MTRKDFLKAVKLAQSPNFEPLPYLGQELDVFWGCALDDRRRIVTLEQVASQVVHHCMTFAGTWDHKEMDNLCELSKRWDLV